MKKNTKSHTYRKKFRKRPVEDKQPDDILYTDDKKKEPAATSTVDTKSVEKKEETPLEQLEKLLDFKLPSSNSSNIWSEMPYPSGYHYTNINHCMYVGKLMRLTHRAAFKLAPRDECSVLFKKIWKINQIITDNYDMGFEKYMLDEAEDAIYLCNHNLIADAVYNIGNILDKLPVEFIKKDKNKYRKYILNVLLEVSKYIYKIMIYADRLLRNMDGTWRYNSPFYLCQPSIQYLMDYIDKLLNRNYDDGLTIEQRNRITCEYTYKFITTEEYADLIAIIDDKKYPWYKDKINKLIEATDLLWQGKSCIK